MIKYVICDIDGVLYNGKINKKLISSLTKRNFNLIINTGRGFDRIKEIFNKKYFNKFYKLMLIENGAKVVTKDGGIVFDNPLKAHIKNKLKTIDVKDIIFANYVKHNSNDYVFFNKSFIQYECIANYNLFIDQAFIDQASRITFAMTETNQRKYKLLFENDMQVEISDGKYCMVLNKGVDKNSAIEYLLKHENLDEAEIAVLGNDYNDVGYFNRHKFIKIAVIDANTPEELMNLADFKTEYNSCHKIINLL